MFNHHRLDLDLDRPLPLKHPLVSPQASLPKSRGPPISLADATKARLSPATSRHAGRARCLASRIFWTTPMPNTHLSEHGTILPTLLFYLPPLSLSLPSARW
jgi:hypothetical protein